MLKDAKAFSSFSVNDVASVKPFYADTLGIGVHEEDGMLYLHTAGHEPVLVYPKAEGHVPATHTVLNWQIDDIENTVANLTARGVRFEQYTGDIQTDAKGIAHLQGLKQAWFKDPAGNILSVLEVS